MVGSSAASFTRAILLHEFVEDRLQVIVETEVSRFCFVPSPCCSLQLFPVSHASTIAFQN